MIEGREFRRACYTAARDTGGRIIEFRIADYVTPNFHEGIIGYRDRTVAVVCTRDSDVMAVAEPRNIDFVRGIVDASPLTFVDAPELAAAVAVLLPGVQVLTPAELNGSFTPAAWPHVLAYDIKYWQPATLGEALFNYWD